MMLGIHAEPIKRENHQGVRINRIFLHQTPLKKAIVARYQEETGYKALRKVATPWLAEEQNMSEEDRKPGKLSDSAAKHVGGVLYVARGTAPGLSFTVGKLARRVRKWRVFDDKALHRLMCYIAATLTQGLEMRMKVENHNTTERLRVETFSDSDYAGDLETARSTNGWTSGFDSFDGVNLAFVDWGSKLQTVVALSTGDAGDGDML